MQVLKKAFGLAAVQINEAHINWRNVYIQLKP